MKIHVAPRTGNHVSLSERLGEQVLELIRSERLEPGDRLPSVKELAERFSVATPTMREALAMLQMAGNLDIRHGSGIYLRDGRARLLLTNPYAGALDADAILNLLRARRLIEPPVAELAATQATDAALRDLGELLAEAERHLSGDDNADEVLGMVNMRFHRGIAAASGNPILSEVVYTLTEVHIKEQMAVLDLYNNRRRDHEEHKRILAALLGRDPVAACRIMREHLDDVIEVVESRLDGGGSAEVPATP